MKDYRYSRSYARDLKIGRQTNKANKYYSCYDLKDPLFTNPFTAAKTAQRNGREIDKLTSNRLLAEYNDDQWICYASQTESELPSRGQDESSQKTEVRNYLRCELM